MSSEFLKSTIRDIPDYPKKGIIFKDITPLLSNSQAFKTTVNEMMIPFREKRVDVVLGIESRGFIFGTPIAYLLNASFVPVRKKGKLPYKVISESYALEYGTDTLEIHEDAIQKGQNVLVVDDLLATGGTVCAVMKMVERLKGNILGASFVIELEFLKGREKLSGYTCSSLIRY